MELIIKMPKKQNTFTGRCCLKFEEFDQLKEMVGTGKLKVISHDGMVRHYEVKEWMINHAYPAYADGVEFMLVTYSESQYKKDKLNAKHFGDDYKRS